ncbi:MAG: hypothetical protein Q8L98_00445 [Chlamydiales bacterium]|nr:hypothetical protein [Chlamydiales bacterium]
MSTAVNNLKITPDAWGTFHSPENFTSELEYIGNQIKSVTREQIQLISQKMYRVLSNRLVLHEKTPQAPIGFFTDSEERIKGTVFVDAKIEFLNRTPFDQDMYNNFSYGTYSVIAQGGVHEYSYEDILKYSIRTGGYHLRELIGDQLAQWPNYRISLRLDVERMAKEEKHFFIVTETEGSEVLSTTSFTFEELEKEKTQLEKQQLTKLRDEHYPKKIRESGQELEKIKTELSLCVKQVKADSSNQYYQQQWAELNKQHEAIKKDVNFYKDRIEEISKQLL